MKKLSLKKIAQEAWQDKMKGGEGDAKKPSDFDPKELKKGIEHEMEHTDDVHVATEIAMDHLKADKDYYKKLEKIEKQ